MSAPERIWATGDTKSGGWQAKTYNSLTCKPAQEYVRADIAATEADALRADNERLRGALERIDDASNHYAMTTTYSEGTLRYAHQSTRNIARTALAEIDGADEFVFKAKP